MAKKTVKETDRFDVLDDDGISYQIIEYTDFIHIPRPGGIPELKPTLPRYECYGGPSVLGTEDGRTFRLLIFDKGEEKEILARRDSH